MNRSVSLVSLRLHCIALHCIALHALGVGRYLVLYPIRLAAPDPNQNGHALRPDPTRPRPPSGEATGRRAVAWAQFAWQTDARLLELSDAARTIRPGLSTVTVIMGWAGHAKSLREREEPNGTERRKCRAGGVPGTERKDSIATISYATQWVAEEEESADPGESFWKLQPRGPAFGVVLSYSVRMDGCMHARFWFWFWFRAPIELRPEAELAAKEAPARSHLFGAVACGWSWGGHEKDRVVRYMVTHEREGAGPGLQQLVDTYVRVAGMHACLC